MAVATILTIVVLYILLPTADVFTDINLAVKLYKPIEKPECVIKFDKSYWACRRNPVGFCSKNENKQHCVFSHYKMATVLLTPCLLNYIVSFYTFFRLTTNRRRYTFIFPLLNIYPQYGKTHPS